MSEPDQCRHPRVKETVVGEIGGNRIRELRCMDCPIGAFDGLQYALGTCQSCGQRRYLKRPIGGDEWSPCLLCSNKADEGGLD